MDQIDRVVLDLILGTIIGLTLVLETNKFQRALIVAGEKIRLFLSVDKSHVTD